MKVLLIHNFYQSSSPSGEDTVYRNEAAMLRDNGIEVIQYERHNDDISGTFKKIKTAFNMVWSKETYGELRELIKKEKPDLAHFHNIWYSISPSAYYACKDSGVPVVQTLHNFRMFCANGLLLRDDRVCGDCIGKFPWRGAAHACFRNSRLYSLPVVASEIIHGMRKTWTNAIDSYIALTEFGKNKFIQCGLPSGRIFVKPNFLADPPSPDYRMGAYALYLGRLSEEKGLDVLMNAVILYNRMTSAPLKIMIIGDGPLKGRLENMAKTGNLFNVEFQGRRDFNQCLDLLAGSCFMIMPSICYENFPMAVREAFACGKPVIASRLGALAEIVQEQSTGLLFKAGDSADLAEKMRWMMENEDACIKMGKNARTEFENKYTAERNFDSLMDIYRKTISTRKT